MTTALDTHHRIAVIIGSVREGRFGVGIGAWVHKSLLDADIDGNIDRHIDADLIDLAELTVPHTMAGHPDLASFANRINAADAVIVITPEYNHSFPGPLKTAIDALREPWQAKPVGFVCYGGLAGGLRAVEALRLVFAELHAMTVRDTVSLHNPWGPASDPAVDFPDSAATDALHRMVRQLLWWAGALRAAKSREPYPG
ncbi:MAG TPA: NAD(P)H-dependent oxidoreductase [Pseudonocardiaceae bacterium]|nr:NAD(P)H-dependent oxidoreductase [Pseudonocardiaceae bacterium]